MEGARSLGYGARAKLLWFAALSELPTSGAASDPKRPLACYPQHDFCCWIGGHGTVP